MTQALLVINAGSSSLKFAVLAARALTPLVHGQIEGLGQAAHVVIKSADGQVLQERRWPGGTQRTQLSHEDALSYLLNALTPLLQGHQLVAVGHRIVHGGVRCHAPVLLTDEVLAYLQSLVPLAPLHQPHNLSPVAALHRLMPGLPQVGCFDTAFHAGSPEVSKRFALPHELHEAGVMRYGFHGLSYEYIALVLPTVDPQAAQGRTVVMHLGNGASMCALQGGASVASTMGFTALDGLPMGTRCGNIDPGVLLWLMDERGMNARQIEHLLYSESGLLGVSGESPDMRTLLASGSEGARMAIELYVYRITRELGSLAAALGGLDAIVFTAGIGEHAAEIRARVCRAAAWLGVELNESANQAERAQAVPDGESLCISTSASTVSAWVIPTNEELMIARHTRRLVRVIGA